MSTRQTQWRHAVANFLVSRGGLGLVMLFLSVPLLNARAHSVVALMFDGKDDFVEISSGLILGSTFTEEAWILPQIHDSKYHGFIGYPAEEAQRAPSLWVVDGSRIHGGFGDGQKWNCLSSDRDTLVLDAWNHVAATYDGVTYRIFVNGIEVVTQRFGATPLRQPVTRIGRIENAFAGAIREVRFWNRARTPGEIRQHMNKGLNGTEEGLVAYFPFDDGAGATTRNSAKGENIGRLKHGPRWMTSTAPIAPAVFDQGLWEARSGIAAHVPKGEEVAPDAAIQVTLREGVRKVDSHLIQLSLDSTTVKTEVTANDDGNLLVRYEPTEAFTPGSKHTVKISYVTTGPTGRTNDFSYSFSVSSSILLSK